MIVELAVDEDKPTAQTLFDSEVGPTVHIIAGDTLPSIEVIPVDLVVASVAGHEVEGFCAELAFPGSTLIPLSWWEALRLMTVVTHHIAPAETALTGTDGPHPVLFITHELVALEAEEVIHLLGAFRTPGMLEYLVGELVAEHEEVRVAVRALDEGGLGPA